MSLVDVVKKAALDVIENNNPVAVFYGTVLNKSPLEINVDQRFTLTGDILVVAESAKDIAAGDKVIILRVQGGQQFVVLDKVVT